MDTQNTSIHISLWNRDFWLLAIANFLLSMAVYMQLSAVDDVLKQAMGCGLPSVYGGMVLGVYGLGIFILGPYCNYLTQRYPRKRVCMWAVAVMLGIELLLHYVIGSPSGSTLFWTGLTGMFCYGASFGLAQMVLSSTLIIDATESVQRTEANYASAWFRRFALAGGPLLAIVLPAPTFADVRFLCYAVVVALLWLTRMPFKSPDDDTHVFCTDRFYLSQGRWLTLNLLPITITLGMSVAMAFDNETFFVQLALGFVIALIAEKYMFANADLQSEFITGCFMIIAALLLYITRSGMPVVEHLAPCLIGIGSGLIGSRILMFFIKLAHHCQRGTAQSSYFLSWELGLAIGLFLTEWLGEYHELDTVGLVLTIVALIFYHFFTHPWYLRHRSR